MTSDHRIPTLDGWRGIAILLVLIDHAGKASRLNLIPTGVHGVTLFFVLSGFLITSRLMSEQTRTGSVSLKNFYRRRFFRLMPCAWLYLLIVFLISRNSHVQTDLPQGILPSLLFFRNFAHIDGIVLTGHFWSLSIEEQFYLIWPAAFILFGARRAAWLAVGASLFLATYRFTNWNHISLVDSVATQYHADALLIGCASALVLPQLRHHLRAWMALPLCASAVYFIAEFHMLVPMREPLVITGLLAVTTSTRSRMFAPLNWRPLTFLGLISYSLYVWQEPFMFLRYQTLSSRFIGVAALFAVALTSYYFVERPMISLGKTLDPRNRKDVTSSASAMASNVSLTGAPS